MGQVFDSFVKRDHSPVLFFRPLSHRLNGFESDAVLQGEAAEGEDEVGDEQGVAYII